MNRCGMSILEYTIWNTKFKHHCRQINKIHRIEKRLEKLVTKVYGRGKRAFIYQYKFYD